MVNQFSPEEETELKVSFERLDEIDKSVTWFSKNKEQLTNDYPNSWLVVAKEQVVASGKELQIAVDAARRIMPNTEFYCQHVGYPIGQCQNCGKKRMTFRFSKEGGAIAFVHGHYSYWCELCISRAQFIYAVRLAANLPKLTFLLIRNWVAKR